MRTPIFCVAMAILKHDGYVPHDLVLSAITTIFIACILMDITDFFTRS